MKICFLSQRNFAYITHNLAVILKEKYGIKDFCCYVYSRPSYNFLKTQKDVNYTSLLLDEDIHKTYKDEILDMNYLQWLEKEFGLPNLWPFIAADRIVMSNQLVREYPYNQSPYTYDEMLKILQVKAKTIIKFLEQEKPDVLFGSVIGAIGSTLLYHIAKKIGIRTTIVFSCLLRNRFILSENYNHFTINIPSSGSSCDYFEAKKWLENFRIQPHPYHDELSPKKQPINKIKQFQFLLSPKKLWYSLLALVQQIYWSACRPKDYSNSTLINYVTDRFKRKIRNLRGMDDLYDDFDLNENFAFFPLQYEPEFSLLVQAPFFNDQIYVARQVARSLPVGYKLYIKEHPLMVEFRPRSYYLELKKIPNVKIIKPAVLSFILIQKAKLIITISGTAGWEASLFKKPVITLGDVPYNQLSFVKNCRAIERLPWVIKKQLENFRYDEGELLNFLQSILQESVEIDLHNLWVRETDSAKKKEKLKSLADLLAKKWELTKNNH